MMRRRRARWAALLVAVAAAAVWALVQRGPRAAPAVALYSNATQQLVVLELSRDAQARPLPCMELGPWAQLVGVRDGRLIALSADRRALAVVELSVLRAAAAGEIRCTAAQPRVVMAPLSAPELPYAAALAGDRVYLSYFADNLVREYRLELAPDVALKQVRSLPVQSEENLGLSDLTVVGDELWVAASGYQCFARDCPSSRFGPSRLLIFDLHAGAGRAGQRRDGPSRELRPENLNAAGLYVHSATRRYVISAGDYHGGHGTLQPIEGDSLGAALVLPLNAAPRRGFALDARHFLVTQFAGAHLFVVDAAAGALGGVYRAGESGLEPLSPVPAELPGRAEANIQHVIPDPRDAQRQLLVDGRADRLLVIEADERGRLREIERIPARAAPRELELAWGVALR